MYPATDWSQCPLVETDPARVSGRPVLTGTRMPADDLVANFHYGLSPIEIAEQFQLEPSLVEAILQYAESHHCVADPAR